MKKAILFFLFFTIPFLYAETISLEEVRVLALANSRSLAQINMNIRSSELNEKSHLFTMLPSLSANYSASMDYLNNKWEFVNPIDTFNAGINMSLTQTIFNGGKNVIQKAINEISSESTRKDALAEYFRVLESADNAYYAVVESLLTLEAAQLSLESAVSALAIAEIRQASGMINLGDYLKAMADREAQENSRNQARRNLALNITKLKSLIKVDNLPDLEQIDLSFYETLIQYLGNISDGDFENLYNRLWNLIAASNPTLGKAALRTQSAQKSLSLAKRDSAPTLNATIVSGNFNYS
ncbi:MAG: TolC family protein, partial [Treponema sp.]|nr:TolC family protein [Treponema sp.]